MIPKCRYTSLAGAEAPKLVIPMHFKTDIEKSKLDPVDRFLKEMGVKAVEAQAKVSITRSALPGETQVLVLDSKR